MEWQIYIWFINNMELKRVCVTNMSKWDMNCSSAAAFDFSMLDIGKDIDYRSVKFLQ